MNFISSSLQFHPIVVIPTDLWTTATASGVTPQDLLIRKCDHGGCKIVSSGHPLVHILLDSAFTIRPLKHGLRSLPHLQNIVSALFGRWQVGVRDSSGPTIHRQEGNIYGEIPSQRTPRMEVLGGPDYICQGNETEQKLSNVMQLERILHVLNNAPFQQASRDLFLREKMVQM